MTKPEHAGAGLRGRLHKDRDFALGFVRRCSCGHTVGEHSLPKLGHPQPCDVCDCKDMDRPEVKEVRFHDPLPGNPASRARRLA